jgi:hypothetical protein
MHTRKQVDPNRGSGHLFHRDVDRPIAAPDRENRNDGQHQRDRQRDADHATEVGAQ